MIVIIFFFGIIILSITLNVIRWKRKREVENAIIETRDLLKPESSNDNTDYSKQYTSKWLFSYAEKDAFRKIKNVTDKFEFTLLAKVRLFDLVEPQKGKNYKSLQYRIQAKHVDFVICDEKLVAKFIVELDDSSHDSADRTKRDIFVDNVLTNCGYKVLRYRAIDELRLEADITQKETSSGTE
ncbi:MAG: DUF2726 domain-containing protein [Oscillospiraceae bacterium]|jgi:very-short-patch-repair endonuclease|nr:DUF2726 domain-containing protein [Oscillospiraceae bacterium]